jgi:hypothetical protein
MDFFTPNEVASIEKVHLNCVHRWLRKRQLKGEKRNGRWKIYPADLKAFTRPYDPPATDDFPTVRQERAEKRIVNAGLDAMGFR